MKRLFTVAMVVAALLLGLTVSSTMTAASASALLQEEAKKESKKDSKKKDEAATEESSKKSSKKESKKKDEAVAEEESKKSSKKKDEATKSESKEQSASKKQTLYVRLGGKKAIGAVVDEFVNNVAADNRINKFFADTAKDPKRLEKFKKTLVDQICEASGGPCKYKGKDMKTAHTGMGVGEADFNALVEDLVKALDKLNVGANEKNELLAALGPMKADIVEK